MTDRILPERGVADGGTPTPIDCDRFDTLLADHLENALPSAARAQADAHLAECGRCRALTEDLLAITRQAAALGPIEPTRDLWAGIAGRIEAPVVPIGRTGEQPAAQPVAPSIGAAGAGATAAGAAVRVERTTTRREPLLMSRRWLAAAASVLVATSVGTTYLVMRATGGAAPETVAQAAPEAAPRTVPVRTDSIAAPTAVPQRVASAVQEGDASPAEEGRRLARQRAAERAGQGAGDARLVTDGVAAAYAPALQTYDREIATLRAALRQRADLDTGTVAVLERSLKIIDQAIAESRRALSTDPGSRLLGDQLNRALEQKVELLRTAVLLPSRS